MRPILPFVFAAGFVLAAPPAVRAQSPSFDCAKATEEAEKAICATPRFARLDVQVARAYERLRGLLGAEVAAMLKDDQAVFIRARDQAFGRPDEDLAARLRERRDFLARIRTEVPGGLTGAWENALGQVTVKPKGVDTFDIAISTVDPVNARWVCTLEGVARRKGDALVIASNRRTEAAPAGWSVRLARRSRMLAVEQVKPKKGEQNPWCGANGVIEGNYFPVRGRR